MHERVNGENSLPVLALLMLRSFKRTFTQCEHPFPENAVFDVPSFDEDSVAKKQLRWIWYQGTILHVLTET